MADKEEIGKVFKDRLDALNTAPDDAAWTNITEELDKRKKKKRGLVIPLWGKLAGIAAGIALLTLLGSLLFDDSFGNETNNEFVNTTNDTIPKVESDGDTKRMVQESLPVIKKDDGDQELIKDEIVPNLPAGGAEKEIEQFVKKDEDGKRDSPKSKLKKANKLPTSWEVASEGNQQNRPKSGVQINNEFKKPKIDTTSSIASEKTDKIQNKENKSNLMKQQDSVFFGKVNTRVSKFIPNKNIKENLNDKNVIIPKDSTAPVVANAQKKNDLLEVIAENEKTADSTITNDKNRSRWAVTTQLAPVFYGSFEDGSSLDPALGSNARSSDANLSYGVKVAFALTDRLHLRSGFGKTNVSYTTSDVLSPEVSDAFGIISFDGFDIVGNSDGLGIPLALDETASPLDLTQEIGYLEIPVEVSYTLVNSKLGVNVIGGVSALILESQVINRTQDNITTQFGSSNNLNNLTMSGTVGLGVHYDFAKAFQLNLEPVLKVPLNSYSNNSSTFKPYIFGIYSGLSYKF